MKCINLAAIFAAILLSACEGGQDDALLVLDEHDRATITSTQSEEQIMVSGTYRIQPMNPGHALMITAQCGTLSFFYQRSEGLRLLEDEESNESAYKCGLGTQASSKIWHLALKPSTGPSMMPPGDWPK
ncbi:hypothetical protein [Pseudomonas sp. 65/3-MNA-CIBAN-0223]|jgi:hypothetical protein|uniref:hypothetical protein n=1 Tax=Pseudomonas sp. 65/3-MNA-CIBAN-0223 TaxID=3140476 RepID=UPI0033282475